MRSAQALVYAELRRLCRPAKGENEARLFGEQEPYPCFVFSGIGCVLFVSLGGYGACEFSRMERCA